jgi:hypothetical protein
MDVAGGMQTFEQLCRSLSRYDTRWASEMVRARKIAMLPPSEPHIEIQSSRIDPAPPT